MIEKLAKTSQQLIKYAATALVGLLIDFATVIFAKEVLNFNYLVAVTAGFMVGLIVVYALSTKYVFGQSKLNKSSEFLFFSAIGIGGLLILNFLVWLMTGKMGINYIASKAIATVAVFMWNFFARRALYHES